MGVAPLSTASHLQRLGQTGGYTSPFPADHDVSTMAPESWQILKKRRKSFIIDEIYGKSDDRQDSFILGGEI